MKLVRKLLKPFKNTPIHPQWLSYRDNILKKWLGETAPQENMLDIGCFDRWPERSLPSGCSYVGLDFYDTATNMYGSQVNCYGDAQALPFEKQSFDKVLMFDVLEHIPDIHRTLTEVANVIVPNGELLIQIPFLYPIHDAPYDYRRPTRFGLTKLLQEYGFDIVELSQRGNPIETACLLNNIALCSTLLSSLKTKWLPLAVLAAPIIALLCILNNLIGWLASQFKNSETLMPFSYQLRFRKC